MYILIFFMVTVSFWQVSDGQGSYSKCIILSDLKLMKTIRFPNLCKNVCALSVSSYYHISKSFFNFQSMLA